MPMSDNGFQWRPNDNGSLTNLRYRLEARKWITALKSAKYDNIGRYSGKRMKADLGSASTFISLPLLLLFFIMFVPIVILKEVFKYNIKIFPGDEPTGRILSEREKFMARIDELKRLHPSKRTEPKIKDMSSEQVNELVAYVKSETAKAYN